MDLGKTGLADDLRDLGDQTGLHQHGFAISVAKVFVDDEVLDGEDVVPGFRLPLPEIFA